MKHTLLLIISFFAFNYSVLAQGDCSSMVILCSTPVSSTCANGADDAELTAANQGCLVGEATRTYWYSICTSTAGTIRFTIDPGGGAGNDFDFLVWGPNLSCPITVAPVRCSYALVSGGSNNTGVNSALNAPATDLTEGGGGNQWVQDISALANECYILVISNYGGGNNTFTVTNSGTATIACTALPIDLLYFTGKPDGDRVRLDWSTATETINDYFTIERSINGYDFEDVTMVDGAGNSSSVLNYFTYDLKPQIGNNYYRLKQTDYNGNSSHSNIISVNFSPTDVVVSNVYPNPTTNDVSLDFFAPIAGNATMEVIDCVGRIVAKKQIQISEGRTILTSEMSQLPIGFYSLKVSFDKTGFVSVYKVIKK